MKICDTHTHSNNSFDAQNSVDDMCQSAAKCGLYAVAITDHCEAPLIKEGERSRYGYFDKTIPDSFREASAAKLKYSNVLKVLCGIELGEPMHDSGCTQRALEYGDFDFIIASVHNIRGFEDFYYLDYNMINIDKVLNQYFDELLETAEFEHFDALAHISYPLRYIKRDTGLVYDIHKYQDKIDLIYKALIKNNKALEINVSGLYKDFGASLPDAYQVKRFKELGGKYITIGSDAHCAEDVGKDIEKGIEIARNAGFSNYTIFEKRRPILIEIK